MAPPRTVANGVADQRSRPLTASCRPAVFPRGRKHPRQFRVLYEYVEYLSCWSHGVWRDVATLCGGMTWIPGLMGPLSHCTTLHRFSNAPQ